MNDLALCLWLCLAIEVAAIGGCTVQLFVSEVDNIEVALYSCLCL